MQLLRSFLFLALFGMTWGCFANGNDKIGEVKSIVCTACHGQRGISGNATWPSIAGQHQAYLLKQLTEMKQNKTRAAGVMAPVLSSLSAQDVQDLANYYSKLPPPRGKTPKEYVELGQRIYRGGDFSKGVVACIACHGPTGSGNGEAGFPMLSGQQALYTLAQLQAFKTGKRRNDYSHIMEAITKRMNDAEMKAVSYYIQGLY